MRSYDTLAEALNDLRQRGYTFDFNLEKNTIACKVMAEQFGINDFEVVEMYRFEGMSSEGDNEVVYAIETGTGVKGVLVDAYGTYAGQADPELLGKLRIH